jgi:hypothetical protein
MAQTTPGSAPYLARLAPREGDSMRTEKCMQISRDGREGKRGKKRHSKRKALTQREKGKISKTV